MKYKKSLLIQISVTAILVLLIGGGVYVYQDNKKTIVEDIVKQDTNVNTTSADIFNNTYLKNYIFPQYGLRFKAPSNYSVTTPPQSSDFPGIADISFKDPQRQTLALQNMRVFVDSISKPISFEEYLKAHPMRDADSGIEYSFKDFTRRKLGNNVYYSILTGLFEGSLTYVYYIIVDTRVFIFFLASQGVDWTNPSLDTENDQYHVMFRNILSTVKFTQPISKVDTSDWTTLTNTKYGIQVQYPKDTKIELINDSDPFSNRPTLVNLLFKPADSKGVFMINVRNKIDDKDCFHTALGSDPDFQVINDITFVRWDISRYLGADDGVNSALGFAYCYVHNNMTYDLVTKMTYLSTGSERPDVERDPVLNQILSTFKFIN